MSLISTNGMRPIFGNKQYAVTTALIILISTVCESQDSKRKGVLEHPVDSFQLKMEGETWSAKFSRIRLRLISAGVEDVPEIYLTAELAVQVPKTISTSIKKEADLIPGLSQSDAPQTNYNLEDSIRYIADLYGLKISKTEHGFLLSAGRKPQQQTPK
jgi:hypothetical protein